MKAKIRSHKFTVLLLLCAVVMATVAAVCLTVMTSAATAAKFPVSVGGLTSGKEMCFYTVTKSGELNATYVKAADSSGTTPDAKWESFKQTYSQSEIVGIAYYDRDSGTLYIRGRVAAYNIVGVDYNATKLIVVVDGDTNLLYGFYNEYPNGATSAGLTDLSIVFRNSSNLTITRNIIDSTSGAYRGGILDIGRFDKYEGGSEKPKGSDFGTLALSGTGKLTIDAEANRDISSGIRADRIIMTDNVSLNIIMNTRDRDELESAITCSEFYVDTTGSVYIDCSRYDVEPYHGNLVFTPMDLSKAGSLSQFGFKLINAESVTFKIGKRLNIYNGSYPLQDPYDVFSKAYSSSNGWKVTETKGDNRLFTLEIKRDTSSFVKANIQVGQSAPITNISFADMPTIQVEAGKSVSLTAESVMPDWMSALYRGKRIKRLEELKADGYAETYFRIYAGDSLSESKRVSNYYVDYTDWNAPTLTYKITGFKPEAGRSYIVYCTFPIVRAYDNKPIATASVVIRLKAVEKKDTEIKAITLTGPELVAGDKNGPMMSKAGSDNGYIITGQSSWNLGSGAEAGKTYSTTVTLKALDGYVFPLKGSDIRFSLKLGDTYVTSLSYYTMATDRKSMTVIVRGTAKHVHKWETKPVTGSDGSGTTHAEFCTVAGCDAKRNTAPHTFGAAKVDGNWNVYTCTACGYVTKVAKSSVIDSIYIKVPTPKAGQNTGTAKDWITLDAKNASNCTVKSVKWTKGELDAVSGAAFVGNFEAGSSYSITVTLEAVSGKTFDKTKQWSFFLWGASKQSSKCVVSDDGKTITQSLCFAVLTPVDVTVTLKEVGADGTLTVPVFDTGKVSYALLGVKIGNDSYFYDYTSRTWSAGGPPKLGKGESAVLALGLFGFNNQTECIAKLAGTSGIKYLDSAYTDEMYVYATYTRPDIDETVIVGVDLTVTAPEHGKTPANKATAPAGAHYTVGAVSWSPSDAAFGAKAYTVSIAVTPNSGYSFADACTFNVNGCAATYKNGKVSYTFPALAAPHTHTYGAWTKLNDESHFCQCTGCDESLVVSAHTFGAWINDGTTGKHYRECSMCHHKVYAAHTPDRAVATEKYPVKCTDCGYEISPVVKHVHEYTGWTSVDDNSHAHVCLTCGTVSDTAKHTYGAWANDDARGEHYHECSVCKHKAYAKHTPDRTAATETDPVKCTACGKVISPALGHTHKPGEWTSLDDASHIRKCTGCGATVETVAHTFGVWTNDDAKSAHYHECTVCHHKVYESHTPDRASATETEPVKCTVCGGVITPATGHIHKADTTKFESDENSHWNKCTGCGEKMNSAAHTFAWRTDKEATETESGSKHEECTTCGYKKASVEIPAFGTETEPVESETTAGPAKTDEPEKTVAPEATTKPDETGVVPAPEKGGSMIIWIILAVIAVAAVAAGVIIYLRKKKSAK